MSSEGEVGRTYIALNLFRAATLNGHSNFQLADFDVEKPDLLNLYSNSSFTDEEVYAGVPVVDESKCRYCGVCAKECSGKAILFKRYVPSVTLIVSRCYACGYCLRACSRNGISIKKKLAGRILKVDIGGYNLIGVRAEEKTEFFIPLIQSLYKSLDEECTVICDFGPGSGTVISSVLHRMDLAVIVLKPGPGWETNLNILIGEIKGSCVTAGIILNATDNDFSFVSDVQDFCLLNSVPLLGIVPFRDKSITKTQVRRFSSESIYMKEFNKIWININELPVFKIMANTGS